MATSWQVKLTNWSTINDQEAIRLIREKVFIEEQAVPVELEWDELDADCLHCLVSIEDGKPVATARLHNNKSVTHIGRMAVLKPYRQQGVGTLMLETLLEQAQLNGVKEVAINAQTTAITFYQRLGFMSVGDEFDDAGIPHYKMTLKLGQNNE